MNTFQNPKLAMTQVRYCIMLFMFVVTSLTFQSCSPSLYFNNESYEATQDIKAETLALISMANESYASHEDDVMELTSKIEDHIETEQARGPKNEKLVQMWQLMMDPNSNLLGGFLKRWKVRNKLAPEFITEVKSIVDTNFDKILNLENSRKRSTL